MKFTTFFSGFFSILILLVGVLSWFSLDFSVRASALLGTGQHVAWTIAIMSAMVLAVLLGISLYVYRAVVTPLVVLREKVSRVARGDFNVDFEIISTNMEIADLMASFQAMTQKLRSMIEAKDRINTELQDSEEFRKQVFTSSRIPMVIMDVRSYRFLDCNPAAVEAYGFATKEQVVSLTPQDVSAPLQYEGVPSAQKASRYIGRALSEGSVVFEWRHQRPDGSVWDAEVHLLSFSAGGRSLLQFALLDVTERKLAEVALRESEAKLHALFLAMTEMVVLHEMIFDEEGNPANYRITDCNPAFTDITGISRESVLGRLASEIYGTEVPPYLKEYAQVVFSGEPYRYETYFPPMDKHFFISVVSPGKNRFATVTTDITERKQAQEAIEYLSFHDHLTGLYNRRFFDEEASRLDIFSNLPLSLIVLDVNGLKLTNDAFGHQAGDRLLQKVARVLQDHCRSDEIVARVGGDEFLILLPRAGVSEAREFGRGVVAALGRVEMMTGRISVAWGCGTKNRQEEKMQDIYRAAENEMYQSKVHERGILRAEAVAFIVKTLYEKVPRERVHAERVSFLCERIGRGMYLSAWELKDLEAVGKFHDIGKIAVSSVILEKPGPLNPEEWEAVRLHPEVGYQIISSVNAYASLAEIVLAHHEHFDGTGYPKGLWGEEIPRAARILAVADAFEAMTWGRPYKEAVSRREAGEELQRCAGTQFDPWIVEVFLKLLQGGEIVFPESEGFDA